VRPRTAPSWSAIQRRRCVAAERRSRMECVGDQEGCLGSCAPLTRVRSALSPACTPLYTKTQRIHTQKKDSTQTKMDATRLSTTGEEKTMRADGTERAANRQDRRRRGTAATSERAKSAPNRPLTDVDQGRRRALTASIEGRRKAEERESAEKGSSARYFFPPALAVCCLGAAAGAGAAFSPAAGAAVSLRMLFASMLTVLPYSV